MAYRLPLKPKFMIFVPLLLVLILAVACGEDATSTPRPTATSQPTATPTTPAVPPTATPVPATATPAPTNTPRPRPTATPTPAPVPTPVPDFFTSKVDQLVVVIAPPGYEINIPWKFPRVNSELDVMFETLVSLNIEGTGYEARLATKWSMRPDGKAWTVQLRKDIPWHFGYGNVTTQDLVHSLERLISEDSIASDVANWKGIIEKAEDLEVRGDHEIVFNLLRTEPDMEFHWSTLLGNYYIVSKAQWDAVGADGMDDQPAGTGSWRFKERKLGASTKHERVENHWRQTPEFKELKQRFVAEEATKLAMLVTDEGHIVSLSTDLHGEAISRGYKRVVSAQTVLPDMFFWGGVHYLTPEKFDPDNPFTNVKVREAMTRAIDRDLINDEIFGGAGVPGYFHYNHPAQPGWDPEFATLGPEMAAYDPDRARELLVEAGYPDGFEFGLHLLHWGTRPEFIQVEEAMAGMWEDIGITVNRIEVDYSRLRPDLKSKNVGARMWGWPGGPPRPLNTGFVVMYGAEATFPAYESETFDSNMAKLQETVDPLGRHELLIELGRELLTQYTSLPLLAFPVVAIVNPEVVAEYNFPGPYYGYSHLEYVKATR